MVDQTGLVNLALQSFGSRTTLTAAQLAAGSNNEAKQAMLVFTSTQNGLLRMAPWNCGMKTAQLTYLASAPGTPENTSPATDTWVPGQPRPPWLYEYQYPADCLKPCWIIPAMTGVVAGVVPFKVGVDDFFTGVAQRVIFTNQQNAVMVYVGQVLDPNIWDPLFQDAFVNLLGSNICMALTGDKGLANMCIQMANRAIEEARKADGNEGLTINDVMPDWIRARGTSWATSAMNPIGFDWGGLLPLY